MWNCLSSYIGTRFLSTESWNYSISWWIPPLKNILHLVILLIFFFFTFFLRFKSFYTSLFYCIHLNFLILFPVTLDMYFYLMNNKDTSLFMPYVGSVCYWFSPLLWEVFLRGVLTMYEKRVLGLNTVNW